MAFKVDENGALAMTEDKTPIWVTETGEERPVDYQGMAKKISELTSEATATKTELRALKEKYGSLSGVENVPEFLEKARQAIEMMEHAPDRDKDIEAQVKTRAEAMSAPLKAQIAAKEKMLEERGKALEDITAKYHTVKVETDVLNSRVLNDRIRPESKPLLVRELLRAGTVTEDGKVVYRADGGEIIYGEDGSPAGVDEALIAILKRLGVDPATQLMSQNAATGSGANPSVGPGRAGIKNPWKKETWNVTAQSELWLKDRAMALNLMKTAGIPVPAHM